MFFYGYITPLKNDPTCKDKRSFIFKDFQKNLWLYGKYDWTQWGIILHECYRQRCTSSLPRNFGRGLCETIAKIMGTKCDLLDDTY
jgi:hypothetical protein